MSFDNKTAVIGKSLFHRSGVRGQTVPGFGGKVIYGGATEAAGEVTHSDRAPGYDNLTVVVSSVMTLLDCVGIALVAVAVCMMAYVISTFSLALVGSSETGVGFFDLAGLVFGLMTTSIRRVAHVFDFFEKAFVTRPFTLDNGLSIVVSRILSVTLSEILVPRSTRVLNLWVRTMALIASGFTLAYLLMTIEWAVATLGLQVFLLTLADIGYVRGEVVVYVVALSTLVFHPMVVVLLTLLGYKISWFTIVGGRLRGDLGSVHESDFRTGLVNTKTRVKNRNYAGKQQRLDKSSRDFMKRLSNVTGLYVPRIFDYATVQQWQSFGASGTPSELDKCLRGLALFGDREMSSMIARVGLRDEWDVQKCSDVSQRLLTNAAFAKYFDVKLAQLFPQMRFSAEKKKGTLVEALVGAAAMEPGSYAAIERFVLVDVHRAFGSGSEI